MNFLQSVLFGFNPYTEQNTVHNLESFEWWKHLQHIQLMLSDLFKVLQTKWL